MHIEYGLYCARYVARVQCSFGVGFPLCRNDDVNDLLQLNGYGLIRFLNLIDFCIATKCYVD